MHVDDDVKNQERSVPAPDPIPIDDEEVFPVVTAEAMVTAVMTLVRVEEMATMMMKVVIMVVEMTRMETRRRTIEMINEVRMMTRRVKRLKTSSMIICHPTFIGQF